MITRTNASEHLYRHFGKPRKDGPRWLCLHSTQHGDTIPKPSNCTLIRAIPAPPVIPALRAHQLRSFEKHPIRNLGDRAYPTHAIRHPTAWTGRPPATARLG